VRTQVCGHEKSGSAALIGSKWLKHAETVRQSSFLMLVQLHLVRSDQFDEVLKLLHVNIADGCEVLLLMSHHFLTLSMLFPLSSKKMFVFSEGIEIKARTSVFAKVD